MIEIRKCSVAEILDGPNAQELVAGYAEECCIPDAVPQRHAYLALEEMGALTCFGAYDQVDHPLDPAVLVGFVSVMKALMPHHGKMVATAESLYAKPGYRDVGTGFALMEKAEQFAKEAGCVCLTYTARVGSALATVLSRRPGCERSHEMFTKWFQ